MKIQWWFKTMLRPEHSYVVEPPPGFVLHSVVPSDTGVNLVFYNKESK